MSVFLKRVNSYCKNHRVSQATKLKILGHYPLFKAHWHASYGNGVKKQISQKVVHLFRNHQIVHPARSNGGQRVVIPISFEPEDLSSFEEIFWGEEYLFPWDIQNATSYVDLGANTGMAALYFKTQFPLETMVLVEANPGLVDVLKANLPGAKIENICVSGKPDEDVTFYISKGHRHSSMEPTTDGEKISHKTISLTKLFDRHSLETVDILKMDIEGAEYMILKDDGKSFTRCRYLVAEVHGPKENRDGFSSQLEDLGFETRRQEKGGFDCETLFARNLKIS